MKKTATALLFLSAAFALVGCANKASASSTATANSNGDSATVTENSGSATVNSTNESAVSARTTWNATEIQMFVDGFGADYSTTFPCYVPEGATLVNSYLETYGCLTVEAPTGTETQITAGVALLTGANFVLTEDTDSEGNTYTTYRITKDNLVFDADIYLDGTSQFCYDMYVYDNGASSTPSSASA